MVQTGTTQNYTCDTHGSCATNSYLWSEWIKGGNSNGGQITDCSINAAAGNLIFAETGTERQVNGTNASYYVTDTIDETLSQGCLHRDSDSVIPTMYFADAILETPDGTHGIFALPKFSSFNFVDYAMGTGATKQFGAYPNYSNGWGLGEYMENSGTTNTSTSAMSEDCCGSTLGYFTESWSSSSGTG